ncbi:MAG TPA: cytochrome P450 [Solirubrobacterales bacterium]|nr:cytochrome P450 [Solirubrobacterales bacterium]
MAYFDPRDESLFVKGEQEAVFSQLRKCNTLSIDSNGVVPIYSLVRYEDVTRAYKEPELFSPSAGLTLDSFDPAQAGSLSRMLETAAPERHGELRSAMQGAFREPHLAKFAEGTRDLLDRFLAASANGEVVDFVDTFARKAAAAMMAELLGVTRAETKRLAPLLRAVGEIGIDASSRSDQRKMTELWLLRALTGIVRCHREGGRSGGLIERLLAATVGGGQLSDHEIALNCLNVVVAGTGASQHSLAGAAAVWGQYAAEIEKVDGDPGRAPLLIDETLRWLTPVVHLTRIVTADTEISGQEVPEGAGVCLWNISANRDEDVFEDAGTFRPDRPPRRHLAFGVGPQHCLGAQIVRMQLGVLLEGMLRNGVRFEFSGPPAWVRSSTVTGVDRLPLRTRRVDPADVQIVDAVPASNAAAPTTKGDSCTSP